MVGQRLRDRKPTGLDQQPVQPGDRKAGRFDDAAQPLRLRGIDALGRFGQREWRDLEPVVAEPRGELALVFERQAAEHFVAQR